MNSRIEFPAEEPPRKGNILGSRIDQFAEDFDKAPARVRRALTVELISAAFAAAREDGEPTLVLKGGAMIEVRLQLSGRATKDLDATLLAEASLEDIEATMRRILDRRLLDGRVHFNIVSTAEVGQGKAVRLEVQVFWVRDVITKIPLEVSSRQGDTPNNWEAITSLNMATTFGIPDVPCDFICLPLSYQLAQKIHAVSRPTDHRRYRDLIDIILLDDLDGATSDADVLDACETVFDARPDHSWPPPPIVGRREWEDGYAKEANEIRFPVTDVYEAADLVQEIVERIQFASPRGPSRAR